jgi:hypothetical protein
MTNKHERLRERDYTLDLQLNCMADANTSDSRGRKAECILARQVEQSEP